MSGWEAHATSFKSTSGADGVAIVGKKCGSVWAKTDGIALNGDLKQYGLLGTKSFSVSEDTTVNSNRFKYIRVTEDGCAIMKYGNEGLVVFPFPGNSDGLLLLYSKTLKPEQLLTGASRLASSYNA